MWARIDDGLPEHRKLFAAASQIQRTGYARALAMVLQAICYSNRTLSDGFVPRKIADSFHDPRPQETISALVKAGLWHEAQDGYQIHDYGDYQINAEEIRQKRERDRERKRGNSAPIPSGVAKDSAPIPSGVAKDSERIPERSRARVPSHPIPSPKEHSMSASADFERFREAYPASRRVGGKRARSAWKNATEGRNGNHLAVMLTALEQQKRSEQWQTRKIIPLMTTWLNEERWTQVLPESQVTQSSAPWCLHDPQCRSEQNHRKKLAAERHEV